MTYWRILSLVVSGGLLLSVGGCGDASRNQPAVLTNSDDVIERVSQKGPVKLVVRFNPREPRLSDMAEMEIQITAEPEVEIKPPSFGQAVGDFLVRDYTELTDRKSTPKAATAKTATSKTVGSNMRRFHYKLEPMHAGRHLIRSLDIEFVDNRPGSEQRGETVLIESEPFDVNVTSELGDQIPNLANLEPMVPPRPLSSSSRWNWVMVAIGGGILVALTLWMRRRKRTLIPEPRRLTPAEIAHAAFAALLAENLPAKGRFKDFYLRLTDIVRHFIEGTTGLRAPEQTTEEFLRAMRLQNVFSTERSYRLQEFLEAADMVKYAGHQPDNDQVELSIARAREFVDYQPSADAVAFASSAEGA